MHCVVADNFIVELLLILLLTDVTAVHLVHVFQAAGSRVRFSRLDGAWVNVAALHLSSFTRVTFFNP